MCYTVDFELTHTEDDELETLIAQGIEVLWRIKANRIPTLIGGRNPLSRIIRILTATISKKFVRNMDSVDQRLIKVDAYYLNHSLRLAQRNAQRVSIRLRKEDDILNNLDDVTVIEHKTIENSAGVFDILLLGGEPSNETIHNKRG